MEKRFATRPDLVKHLTTVVKEQRAPLCYIRFGDLEFMSMLGQHKTTGSEKHSTMPGILGPRFKAALKHCASFPEEQMIVGICERYRWYAQKCGVRDATFADCLPNRILNETTQFIRAIKSSPVPKFLVGRKVLGKIADGLGATHIRTPPVHVGRYWKAVQEQMLSTIQEDSIIIFAAGPIKHVLLTAWMEKGGMAFDVGHVFDPIVGQLTRRHLRRKKWRSRAARAAYGKWLFRKDSHEGNRIQPVKDLSSPRSLVVYEEW